MLKSNTRVATETSTTPQANSQTCLCQKLNVWTDAVKPPWFSLLPRCGLALLPLTTIDNHP